MTLSWRRLLSDTRDVPMRVEGPMSGFGRRPDFLTPPFPADPKVRVAGGLAREADFSAGPTYGHWAKRADGCLRLTVATE